MRRSAIAVLALLLLRGDMYQDASNAKLPEAITRLMAGGAITPGPVKVGTGAITYLSAANVIGANAHGQPSFYGETRSSQGTSGGTIGNYQVVYADHPTTSIPVWSGYDECNVLAAAYQPFCIAREISLYSELAAPTLTPYVDNVTGHTVGLRIDSGKGVGTGTPQTISALLQLTNNGAKAKTGVLVASGALDPTRGSGGNGIAVEMAEGQSVRWLNGSAAMLGEVWAGSFAGSSPAASGLNSGTSVNVAGEFYVGGKRLVASFGGAHRLFAPDGSNGVAMAGGYSVYGGGSHLFRNQADTATYATIDANGLAVPVMPTSCTGKPAGTLWNDALTVKVCP